MKQSTGEHPAAENAPENQTGNQMEYASGNRTEYASGNRTEYASGNRTEYASGNAPGNQTGNMPGNPEWERELPNNPFMEHNFIQLAETSDGRAVCTLTTHPESLNIYGYVHGGAIYTLADNVAGYAAHMDGRAYVTQSGSLYFTGNQRGGILTATAQVRHRGRRTCLADVSVTGDGGQLIATGSFEYFCVRQAAREI